MKKVLDLFDEEGEYSVGLRDFQDIGHRYTQLTKEELSKVFREINPHASDNLELRDFDQKLIEIKEMKNT